jgi:uncharacterized protein YndB with AHSA1/START domain
MVAVQERARADGAALRGGLINVSVGDVDDATEADARDAIAPVRRGQLIPRVAAATRQETQPQCRHQTRDRHARLIIAQPEEQAASEETRPLGRDPAHSLSPADPLDDTPSHPASTARWIEALTLTERDDSLRTVPALGVAGTGRTARRAMLAQEEREEMTGPRDRLVLEQERVFDASIERVYSALTDPTELANWWGPHGFTTPEVQLDLRVGGRYRFTMQPPGGDAFHLCGEFLEIRPPDRLSFTFRWDEPDPDDRETVAVLSLRPVGGRTSVSLSQGDFATEGRLELHRNGWADSFERLAAELGLPGS